MKVRIKFSKQGPVRFLGHLDTMRYFQKAVRRALLPAAFSGGYSPHMIMSFASPLGVGMESLGEYFDLELTEDVPTAVIEEKLNAAMADGFSVLSARKVADGKASVCMALVAACDYILKFYPGKEPACENWQQKLMDFYAQEQIIIVKETKKSVRELNIRPLIYGLEVREDGSIFVSLSSTSANYIRPDMFMDAFFAYLGEEKQELSNTVMRTEVYADLGNEEEHRFVPLEDLGEVLA